MAVGFFSQLGSLALQAGASFIGSQVVARQQKAARRQQLQSGSVRPPRAISAPRTHPVTTRPTAVGIAGVMGPGSAVPPWHAAVHAGLQPKRRRMNVLNYSALKRSLRRLEGFQRTVKRVEKAMPKKTSRRRSAAVIPQHHH